MRILVLPTGIVLSILIGLFITGVLGLILFSIVLSLSSFLSFKKKISAKNFLIVFFIVIGIGFSLKKFCGLTGADEKTTQKVNLIEQELKTMGYNPKWVCISQKRNTYFNAILLNSVPNSQHLNGQAIDLFVFDIDGNYMFDKNDIKLIEKANTKVEKLHPKLRGALGDYFHKSYLTSHMIHIDTRGKSKRYP